MTAEVAVLNKSGIALAADSAVTTGFPGNEKIFTTANKIFTLSKFHPVGIMINGHVEHCGYPWEVIVKDFRRKLRDTAFDDLRGYVNLFLETVGSKRFLSADAQSVTAIASGLSSLGELENRVRDGQQKWLAASIKEALEGMAKDALAQDPVPGFENIKYRTFDATYGSYLEEVAEKWGASKLPKSCWSLFKHVVFAAMTRQLGGSHFSTGIVIAGYGEEDLFPKLYEFIVDGAILDTVRCYEVDSLDIAKDPDGAAISTFAQDETVQAYLNGLDERFRIFNVGLFGHVMQLISEEILREHTQLTAQERLVAGMSRTLLNIAKRSLPRLMLSGVSLASKDAV